MAVRLRGRQNIREMATSIYVVCEILSAAWVVLALFELLVIGETAVWAVVDVALIALLLWTSIYLWLVRSSRWP